jgi:zinc protease
MWGELYSRKNPIGNHGIIRSATAEKMETIKEKYYWPNNSLLIVSGDVGHADVFEEVQSIFGSWKPSSFDPFEKYPVPNFPPLQKNDYFIVESKEARVPVIMFEWQGPDTRNDVKNTYVADIFSYILHQNASRLHKALIESGLALQLNTSYLTEKYTGPIGFLIIPNPSRFSECLEVFKQQLAMFDSEDYFSDEQLAIAKRQYEIRRVRDEEITSQFTHTLSYWWCSASIGYFNTYLDNLNTVTREDIRNYVRKYVKDKPHCAGLLIDPALRRRINADTYFKGD